MEIVSYGRRYEVIDKGTYLLLKYNLGGTEKLAKFNKTDHGLVYSPPRYFPENGLTDKQRRDVQKRLTNLLNELEERG